MTFFRRIDRLWERAEELLLAFGTIGLSGLLLINVFLRFFFSKSIVMAEEVGQIIVLSVTYFGLSYVARYGRHIRMSVIYDLIGARYRKILAIFIPLVTSFTLFYLSYIAFRYVGVIRTAQRVTSSLQIPVYRINLVVAIGLLTAAAQFFRIFLLNVSSWGEEDFVGLHRQ